jgi:hypothetical protein
MTPVFFAGDNDRFVVAIEEAGGHVRAVLRLRITGFDVLVTYGETKHLALANLVRALQHLTKDVDKPLRCSLCWNPNAEDGLLEPGTECEVCGRVSTLAKRIGETMSGALARKWTCMHVHVEAETSYPHRHGSLGVCRVCRLVLFVTPWGTWCPLAVVHPADPPRIAKLTERMELQHGFN